ncbi:MAG: peptidoglycan-associated lipoprotein Pal [Rickettsiaceae bacterium]
MLKNLSIILFVLSSLILSACCSSSDSQMSSRSTPTIYTKEECTLMEDFEQKAGDRVFFAFNSSEVSHSAKETLDKQITWLKNNSNVSVIIEGYCDDRGTREYNLALGERRAESVKQYMIRHGINSSRIGTISYGKERPAVIGTGEAVWKQNRRCVTLINND